MKNWVCENCGLEKEGIVENPTCVSCMRPMQAKEDQDLKTKSIAEMLELCMTYAVGATNARLDPKMVWDYREKIQAMRREILTRAGAWEKAAMVRPEIEGAMELAFELGADICSDHCDLDPADNQHMAHCYWCDQATRVYQMLKAALGASPRPATKEPEQKTPEDQPEGGE